MYFCGPQNVNINAYPIFKKNILYVCFEYLKGFSFYWIHLCEGNTEYTGIHENINSADIF